MQFQLKNKFKHLLKRAIIKGKSLTYRKKHKVLFIYSADMGVWGSYGRELYQKEPVFRETIRRCHKVSHELFDFDLLEIMTGNSFAEKTSQFTKSQLMVWTSNQIALTDLWKSKGIESKAVLGMCGGDPGSLYGAGGLTLEEAVAASFYLYKVADPFNGVGEVILLETSKKKAQQLCKDCSATLYVVFEKSIHTTLIFCHKKDLNQVKKHLSDNHIQYHLTDYNAGLHTPLLNQTKDLYKDFEKLNYKPFEVDFYSCSGKKYLAGEKLNSGYWLEMISETCFFSSTLLKAVEDGFDVMVDIGDAPTYLRELDEILSTIEAQPIFLPSLREDKPEQDSINETLRLLGKRNLKETGAMSSNILGEVIPSEVSADTINLDSPNFVRNYIYYFEELRKKGSVQFLPKHNFWIVLDYKDVVSAIKNTEVFGSQGEVEFVDDILIGVDPPIHTRARRILAPFFSPHSIESLRENIEECAESAFLQVQNKKRFDLVENFTMPFTLKVMATFFGLNLEEIDKLEKVIGSSNYNLEAYVPPLGEFFVEQVNARKENPENDISSKLLQSKEKDKFSHDEIVGAMQLLLCAGITTTSMLISSAMAILLRFPKLYEELKNDFGLIPAFIEEVLRIESPVQFEWRKVLEDTELAGVKLKAGSEIGLCIGAANRDSKQFSEPNKVVLNRSKVEHLAFGMGAHYCLGANLSRLEADIAIRKLITALPDLQMVNPFEELKNGLGYRVRAIDSLLVESK